MISIDTNLVCRYLLNDDVDQARAARKLIDEQEVFLTTTVVLESAWVLGAVYRLPIDRVVEALTWFLGHPNVSLQDHAAVTSGLQWCAAGLGLADALHLASSQGCHAFATFDRELEKRAARVPAIPVSVPGPA
ncbi:MAG TPA: type II toxin-antitoxin system VapC family toxin [Caulobacteraceae bacterium]|nr:type II toxin-antitoxin system VapC family toxin [Caulobacteraceae bacterium]